MSLDDLPKITLHDKEIKIQLNDLLYIGFNESDEIPMEIALTDQQGIIRGIAKREQGILNRGEYLDVPYLITNIILIE